MSVETLDLRVLLLEYGYAFVVNRDLGGDQGQLDRARNAILDHVAALTAQRDALLAASVEFVGAWDDCKVTLWRDESIVSRFRAAIDAAKEGR